MPLRSQHTRKGSRPRHNWPKCEICGVLKLSLLKKPRFSAFWARPDYYTLLGLFNR